MRCLVVVRPFWPDISLHDKFNEVDNMAKRSLVGINLRLSCKPACFSVKHTNHTSGIMIPKAYISQGLLNDPPINLSGAIQLRLPATGVASPSISVRLVPSAFT